MSGLKSIIIDTAYIFSIFIEKKKSTQYFLVENIFVSNLMQSEINQFKSTKMMPSSGMMLLLNFMEHHPLVQQLGVVRCQMLAWYITVRLSL
jgi:hypothetical protein